jgi:hypothetical protein
MRLNNDKDDIIPDWLLEKFFAASRTYDPKFSYVYKETAFDSDQCRFVIIMLRDYFQMDDIVHGTNHSSIIERMYLSKEECRQRDLLEIFQITARTLYSYRAKYIEAFKMILEYVVRLTKAGFSYGKLRFAPLESQKTEDYTYLGRGMPRGSWTIK